MRMSLAAGVAFAAMVLASCDEQGEADRQVAAINEFSRNHQTVTEDTWKDVAKLTCRPVSLNVCGVDGCKAQQLGEADAKVWLEFEPAGKSLSGCDAMGCDRYAVDVNISGAWANIHIPGNAGFVRLTGVGDFMEAVTTMDTVYLYRGHCE